MDTAQQGLLLIDGFNVLHALPEGHSNLQLNLQATCSNFVEQVRVIHDVEGISVVVVFDGDGESLTLENPGNQATFAVVFSSKALTADGVIEQFISKSMGKSQCIVISRDGLVVESARARGALALGPDYLFDWIARCEAQQSRQLEIRRKKEEAEWKQSSPWDILG